MKTLCAILLAISTITGFSQTISDVDTDHLLSRILTDPGQKEIQAVEKSLRNRDLTPRQVILHDTMQLSNGNRLFILSHQVEGNQHFGAVILPKHSRKKMPVILFLTGGDGFHTAFDVEQDFNHAAASFPNLLGGELDNQFIVVIPGFRGQDLTIDGKKYKSGGSVQDAFDGATTDALAMLNATLSSFRQADEDRIAVYGGSRGGTVALLAASRDARISRAVVVAAPTDMKALYLLYPDQFKVLFFNDLLAGRIDEQQARQSFLSCSPIYFVKTLPLIQLHHDNNDPFVPVPFAKNLVEEMNSHGKNVQPYFYNEGIHGFWNDKSYWQRVVEFIKPLAN